LIVEARLTAREAPIRSFVSITYLYRDAEGCREMQTQWRWWYKTVKQQGSHSSIPSNEMLLAGRLERLQKTWRAPGVERRCFRG
jgi:hypothetical protein